MTSEVLLMNLEAVALGADSVISWSSTGRPLTMPGIDKIFMINADGPVAAMFYNVASFAGLPWRTVLGEFAHSCGKDTLPMAEYRRRLIAFLADIGAYPALPLDPKEEVDAFRGYIAGFLIDYLDWLEFAGWDGEAPVTADEASEAIALYRETILIETPAHSDEDGKDVAEVMRPRIEQASEQGSERLSDFLGKHLGAVFQELLGPALSDAMFPQSEVEPLMQLAVESIAVEWLPDACDNDTGLVLTGFGAGQAVPSALSLRMAGAFGGVLKYSVLETYTVDTAETPVIVETFAQANLTEAFLNGATPGFAYNTRAVAGELLGQAFGQAVRRIAHGNRKLAVEMQASFRPLRRDIPALALGAAKAARRRFVLGRLRQLLDAANAKVLGDYAQKFMAMPITENEIVRNDTVGRPVHILTMARGSYKHLIDGVPQ